MEIITYAEPVSFILAFVSVVLAVYGQYKAYQFSLDFREKTAKQIENVETVLDRADKTVERLEYIESQLSTIPVGPFPSHIPTITNMLETAQNKILIATQSLGYGASTSPKLYTEYAQLLRTKALNGVEVKVLHPSGVIMDRARNLQFDNGSNWKSRIKDEEFKSKLDDLARRVNRKNISTFHQFKQALNKENQRCRAELDPFIELVEIDYLCPVQLWICDGNQAVFSITSGVGTSSGTAFKTHDQGIIASLINVFEYFSDGPVDTDTHLETRDEVMSRSNRIAKTQEEQ